MSFLEHQTLSSSPDRSGHSYWASFSPKSHAKGSNKTVHKAVLNGTGPRGGRKAMVKAFRNMPGTEALCDVEIARSEAAMATAHAFNDTLGRSSLSMEFVIPTKAPMDEVAMRLLSRSSRRLTKSEWVLLEEELAKELEVFVTKAGLCSDHDPIYVRALETFVHFSFHHSAGRQVICGLKGVRSHKGFRLTTPVIHSAERKFGATDRGDSGIRAVFKEHCCTELCRELATPDSLALYSRLGQLQQHYSEPALLPPPWSEHPPHPHDFPPHRQGGEPTSDPQPIPPYGVQRQPSAPYDPEVFSEEGSGSGSPMFYTARLPSSPSQHFYGLESHFTSSQNLLHRFQENQRCFSPFQAHRFEGNHYSPMPGRRRANTLEECSPPGYYSCQETPFGSFPPSQLQYEAGMHRAMTCGDQVTRDVKPRSFSAGASDVPSFPLIGSPLPFPKT